MVKANFFILLITLCLMSCAHEVNYRGVSATKWQQLTAEQKQLIVDQAYEEEINHIK